MKTFCVSFVVGAILALAVDARADDDLKFDFGVSDAEALPLPIHSPNGTANVSQNRIRHSDLVRASRVARAKQVDQNWLQIESMARWQGINTFRPHVNAGYVFIAHPQYIARWSAPIHPYYLLP